MRLAIVGPARSGKDEAALWFARHAGLRYTHSTSQVIWPHAAKAMGVSLEKAWETRHQCRMLWRKIGDDLRRDDPGYLARNTLQDGDLCVGVRSFGEIRVVRDEKLVDLVIWVDRTVPPDLTLEYGEEMADIVIPNRWSVEKFHFRLFRLAQAIGLNPTGFESS